MLEKIGSVKNPLTIIAIFAGIAEINGTVVTSLVNDANQTIFVWFLILFPVFLVLAFFLTLNFNHHALYAPSDFKDESNYFKGFKKATDVEKIEKVIREIEEGSADTRLTRSIEQPRVSEQATNPALENTSTFVTQKTPPTHKARVRYELAESLGLKRFAKELGIDLVTGVSAVFGGRKFIFDAVIPGKNSFDFVEVSFVNSPAEIFNRVTKDIDKFSKIYEYTPDTMKSKFSLTIIIVTASSFKLEELDLWYGRTAGYVNNVPFTLDIKTYDLPSLEKEFNQ